MGGASTGYHGKHSGAVRSDRDTGECTESLQYLVELCHNPTMWRVVDLKSDPDNIKTPQVLEEICRVAVDRSQGQLLKLYIENFGNTDLLNYVAKRYVLFYLFLVVSRN